MQCLFPSWENYIPARDTRGKQLGGNTPTAENFPSDSEYAYKLEIREESLFFLRECTNKTFLQCKAEIQSQFTQIFSHQDDHQVRSWHINSYVTEKKTQLLLIARISLRQFFQGLHFPRHMFSSYQLRSSMSKTTQSEMSNQKFWFSSTDHLKRAGRSGWLNFVARCSISRLTSLCRGINWLCKVPKHLL